MMWALWGALLLGFFVGCGWAGRRMREDHMVDLMLTREREDEWPMLEKGMVVTRLDAWYEQPADTTFH